MLTPKIFAKIIREELTEMLKEADKKAAKIDKKLETIRKKLKSNMGDLESTGTTSGDNRPMKRIQISTVAQMIDIPVNELMLHFLNNVKNKNERSLVEYRLGHVYFYAE